MPSVPRWRSSVEAVLVGPATMRFDARDRIDEPLLPGAPQMSATTRKDRLTPSHWPRSARVLSTALGLYQEPSPSSTRSTVPDE
jgi:hypothetical protein